MKVSLLTHTQNPLNLLFASAKGTTSPGLNFDDFYQKSFYISDKAKIRLVGDVLKSSHWSIARGVMFSFSISEASCAFGRQLFRTKVGADGEQQSLRYNRINLNTRWFVVPESLRSPELELVLNEYRHDDEHSDEIAAAYSVLTDGQLAFIDGIREAARAYEKMLGAGVPAEDARSVLPFATSTNIVFNMSLEAIKNMLANRLCTRAQTEYREFARLVRKEVLKVLPWAGEFLTIKCLSFGSAGCPEKQGGGCGLLKRNGGKVEWLWEEKQ